MAGDIQNLIRGECESPVTPSTCPIRVSIGIIAWNEELSIGTALKSLFKQTLFEELHRRNLHCEIQVLANGCDDKTAEVARKIMDEQETSHPASAAFTCRVLELEERGKLQTWNRYVHETSAREARCLILMDADILLHKPETLWLLFQGLENNPEAVVTVDEPIKDIALQNNKSLRKRISLWTSSMTKAASGQMTGQLYCIRAEAARRLYLPRDLGACDDGFIKKMICTDFLTRETANPARILQVPKAAHIFEAYTGLAAIIKNQKRQMIGQTMVHLLADHYLASMTPAEKSRMAILLRDQERNDPNWLKPFLKEHLKRVRFFWRLFPGILTFRFKRLALLRGWKRLAYLPVALIGLVIMLFACWQAWRHMRRGGTNYWPDTRSDGLAKLSTTLPTSTETFNKNSVELA